ncbi:Zn-dependent hydrolase [Pseudogracilibacillus sp. SE30717A]|uniref:Zn-dependent hydrolase n=1 Tax=Pseudogracilibacillus sp. SE30717A TaxID=3098293 RepID=UPI00300DF1E2
MNLKRLKKTLEEINQYGYTKNGINRLAYTKTEQRSLQHLISLFKKEGMTVKKDAAGNVIARREGMNPKLPAVACGSHIDTVYNAGHYDGTVGVVAGLEVIRSLNDEKIVTEHPIEVIVFACEESARFGVATIGSKAMTGLFNGDDFKQLTDKDGVSLEAAFKESSLNIEEVNKAVRGSEEIKVFYELHIEQGPVLEKGKKDIGIVTGIAAPTRYQIEITGQASHSGTTPMALRKDAFLGAAEIALGLEQIAMSEANHGTVATTGVCDVLPGAMNVVPSKAVMKVDIRSISLTSKERVVNEFLQFIKQVEKDRQLEINITQLCDETPIDMDLEAVQMLTEACEELNYSYIKMPSGAGHDAMNMATLYPTGMIFVPSENGLSHNPAEYTPIEQIVMGATILKEGITKAARVVNRGEQRASI